LYVDASKVNPQMDEKRRRALEGLEKIKKAHFKDIEGKTDVAKNHDKYLNETYS